MKEVCVKKGNMDKWSWSQGDKNVEVDWILVNWVK